MMTRLWRQAPPRLVVRTTIATFAVVALVLTAVLLLIALQGRGYVRAAVVERLAAGACRRVAAPIVIHDIELGVLEMAMALEQSSPERLSLLPARPASEAVRELWRFAGTQFDAEVVQALVLALPGLAGTLDGSSESTLRAAAPAGTLAGAIRS